MFLRSWRLKAHKALLNLRPCVYIVTFKSFISILQFQVHFAGNEDVIESVLSLFFARMDRIESVEVKFPSQFDNLVDYVNAAVSGWDVGFDHIGITNHNPIC